MFEASCEELERVVGDINNLRGMNSYPDASDPTVVCIMKLYIYFFYYVFYFIYFFFFSFSFFSFLFLSFHFFSNYVYRLRATWIPLYFLGFLNQSGFCSAQLCLYSIKYGMSEDSALGFASYAYSTNNPLTRFLFFVFKKYYFSNI